MTKDRVAFHAWAEECITTGDLSGYQGPSGEWLYDNTIVELCWQAWKAAQSPVEPPAKCTCQPLAQQLGVPFGRTAVAVDPECPVHRVPRGADEVTLWECETCKAMNPLDEPTCCVCNRKRNI